jgi:ATP-dependent Clp protease adaptor protein ClpS
LKSSSVSQVGEWYRLLNSTSEFYVCRSAFQERTVELAGNRHNGFKFHGEWRKPSSQDALSKFQLLSKSCELWHKIAPTRPQNADSLGESMSDIEIGVHRQPAPQVQSARPRLHRVILLNDDFTPREFVVSVLAAIFRMTPAQAQGAMLTAHRRGVCVVAVFTREIAETKARQATDMGRREGHPLTFTTTPED